MTVNDIPQPVLKNVRRGTVIPAQPLALDDNRQFDEQRQRALTRYYIDAGAGGIAVGVHSTQFEIREPEHTLLEPVLSCASETIDDWSEKRGTHMFKIAGVCGNTEQALREAELAGSLGYHACLLSLAALASSTNDELVAHCQAVSEVMPVIGFYLQPAVGGRALPYEFWRKFAEIENVIAIKMAPFNRYQTFDVIRGVCEAGRENDITLYTGNDDNIVADLLTTYKIQTDAGEKSVRIKGGLLGHWCVWTQKAVTLLNEIHDIVENDRDVPAELLTRGIEITDSNAVFFDAANKFAGCIPGLHEVLMRQGLMKNIHCLNPHEVLSPGQKEEIDRVYKAYPHLNDDAFVAEHLNEWLG